MKLVSVQVSVCYQRICFQNSEFLCATGAAYVFISTNSGLTWSQKQRLIAVDGAAYDTFGSAVVMFYDTIVVGSRYSDEQGSDSGTCDTIAC